MVKKLSRISSDSLPRFCLTQYFGRKWKERTNPTGQPVIHDADDLAPQSAGTDRQTEIQPISPALTNMAVQPAQFSDCQMTCSMLYFSISTLKLSANCAGFANVSGNWHQKTVCGCPMKRSTHSCDHVTVGKGDFIILRLDLIK